MRKTGNKRIEVRATAQEINMPHQIYMVGQMNVCRCYNGSRKEQKHSKKVGTFRHERQLKN